MEIEVVSPIDVEAEVQTYTLVSDDIYVRRYDASTVPDWYRSLVEGIVTTDPTIIDIQGAVDFLTLQGTGFSQNILNLESADSMLNSSLISLASQVGANTAGIGNLQVTKVDSDQAVAIATDVVGSSFGTGGIANAWFTNQISTYASEIAANASSISTLSATLDGHTVSIETIEQIAIDANEWSAAASKLITGPDGSVTGWSFADGSGIQSEFKIKATNFSISDGTTGYTPFSIDGSNILFNGVVDFTNTNNYGTTTIDGDNITTGTITTNLLDVNEIKTGDIFVDNSMVSSDFNGNRTGSIGNPTTGFRLSANAAGTDDDPTIYGAYIKGGTVSADSIVSGSLTTSNVLSSSVMVGSTSKQLISDLYDNTGGTSTLIVLNIWIANFSDALKTIRLYRNGSQIFVTENNLPSRVSLSFVDNAGYNTYSIRMDGYRTGSNVVNTLASFIYFKK